MGKHRRGDRPENPDSVTAMTKEKPSARVRKAVIPAAGLGIRFQPATKSVPKALFPLVDKPAVQYVVEEAAAAGIEQVILVTGRDGESIQEHFEVSFALERLLVERDANEALERVRAASRIVKVTSVRQKEARGLAHAILTAHELIGAEPFAVMLPDDIILARTPCLRQLIDVHERHGGTVLGLHEVGPERIGRYGVVAARVSIDEGGRQLQDIVSVCEKPAPERAPSRMAIVGRYILTPGVMRELAQCAPDPRGIQSLAAGMTEILKRERVHGWLFEGRWFDVGTPLGFIGANLELALERPDLAPEVRAMIAALSPEFALK